ncbi:PKD domain-containing protein [Chitinophaga horti]|uniref:PKD domain-containing protein n=1 Tax=Chitinophaga horti TaxID=2920382 RepID=A0ABY6J496_9BACT|nr:PKD domain-containing protein [Chitinophaga horti]UYQ93119.1 PKD domain-containing protein [Chitinophaga horti]
MFRALPLITVLLFCAQLCLAQNNYILNGSAQQKSCNCYQLTADQGNQSGTAWNRNKISLTNSFVYTFDVNLGCKDNNGADGIGFILQTQGTSLGASGQGIGFAGVSPSVGILIDTWQNNNESDPPYDHVAIQINGVSNHSDTAHNLAGPVTALPNSDNIEDCNWHIFKVSWDAATQLLTVDMDGVNRLSLTKDLVTDVFNGDPMVYWGFAGSTGGSSNLQQFCAALRPQFASGQTIFCEGTPVQLYDNSSSFGSITRWFWDLGDGTTYLSTDPATPNPPIHNYQPGIYDVKLVIQDNSGCISDTLRQQVTLGTYPVPDFNAPALLCDGNASLFQDASTVRVGTINRWAWDFDNGQTSTRPSANINYAEGQYTVQLTVTTAEGCSASTTKTLDVLPAPNVAIAATPAVCLGEATAFTGSSLDASAPVINWTWDLGDQQTSQSAAFDHTYASGGQFTVRLFGTSANGCPSPTATATVRVVDVAAHAGRDTLIAVGQPLQLAGQGGSSFVWTPSTGLNNPLVANPVATLNADQTYILTSSTAEGCVDRDTINIKVYSGPEFWVPSGFTPNNDGVNDLFRVIAAGIPRIDYLRVFDRWGGQVFYTNQLSVPWDGTMNGRPMPIGTYVWTISGKDYTGKLVERKGTITLIR